jgi:hypothetical protein
MLIRTGLRIGALTKAVIAFAGTLALGVARWAALRA